MASRASQPDLLEQRIAANTAAQQVDLVKWIFEQVQIRPQDRVLELCSGTGGQTLKILELLGESGRAVALDVSKDALKTLESKTSSENRRKLTLVEGSLDHLSQALRSADVRSGFDLIFCAYGLYYSSNPRQTLDDARSLLHRDGRIVVVGPFGLNNRELFEIVRASGVTIPEAVIVSSELFMFDSVLPWAAQNFECTSIHTMVNQVIWQAPERVLQYWANTTFYDAERRPAFESLVRHHFEQHSEFVNRKWVMMVEMTDARG